MTTVKDEKQRIDYLLSRDDTTDRELEKIYLEAVNLLRSIISEEFNSYAVDGVLTPQDLTRRVTKKDMVLLKKLYDQLPDNLELSEQQRVNYYLASSQTSLSRLLIASIGIALVGVTHKVAKIIRKNNKRAVSAKHPNFNYFKAILERYIQLGLESVEEAKELEAKFEANKQQRNRSYTKKPTSNKSKWGGQLNEYDVTF